MKNHVPYFVFAFETLGDKHWLRSLVLWIVVLAPSTAKM